MARTQGRNPMAGRHGTGQQSARPGSIRGGQGAHVANGVGTGHNQQTASRTAMIPRPPVLSDAADTSKDAQRMISRPPMPFENPHGAVNVPAPVNRNASHPYGLPAKTLLPKTAGANLVSNHASIHNGTATTDDMLAAVGEPRKPSGYNDVNYFRGAGKRQSGRPGNSNTNTSKRENARVRQDGY
jgi:hypothetical protein